MLDPRAGGVQEFNSERRQPTCGRDACAVGQAVQQNLSTLRYERDGLTNERHCRSERCGALCRTTYIPILRFAMGHSTPMLLNADTLPEILTARELEGFIRIDVKTIYAYVKGGQIPYMRMGSNLRFCKREILAWLEERHYRP